MNIGIDLGTTNSALAYVAEAVGLPDYPEIRKYLQIPAIVSLPRKIEPILYASVVPVPGRSSLASALARASKARWCPPNRCTPRSRWLSTSRKWIARRKFFPGTPREGGRVLSPVEVSNAIISHIRDAWNQAHPNARHYRNKT